MDLKLVIMLAGLGFLLALAFRKRSRKKAKAKAEAQLAAQREEESARQEKAARAEPKPAPRAAQVPASSAPARDTGPDLLNPLHPASPLNPVYDMDDEDDRPARAAEPEELKPVAPPTPVAPAPESPFSNRAARHEPADSNDTDTTRGGCAAQTSPAPPSCVPRMAPPGAVPRNLKGEPSYPPIFLRSTPSPRPTHPSSGSASSSLTLMETSRPNMQWLQAIHGAPRPLPASPWHLTKPPPP